MNSRCGNTKKGGADCKELLSSGGRVGWLDGKDIPGWETAPARGQLEVGKGRVFLERPGDGGRAGAWRESRVPRGI